ncbi:hypothetical protein M0P98_00570 [bacterium]|nr:hypothetical protein [bacterium]
MRLFHKFIYMLTLFTIFCVLCQNLSADSSTNGKNEAFRIKFDITSKTGWGGSRGGVYTDFSYNDQTGIASFALLCSWQGITKQVELTPGHYILRAVAKTNSHSAKLFVDKQPVATGDIFVMPIGISEEFREIILPFYVEGTEKKKYYTGIARAYGDPAKHRAVVQVKEIEIVRLGNTVLPDDWTSKTSTSIIHGLDTLKKISHPDRPGKVIFKDSFIGTELWLMTQGGEVNLSYSGSQDFSNEGKYFFAGKRTPGDIIRTDGTFRHRSAKPKSWANRIPWLFPWEEKRLPEGSDPSEWINVSRSFSTQTFLNLETGKTHIINLPQKEGWQIIKRPSEDGGRGPRLKYITHEILVWQSEDRKEFALSDIEGNNFRSFKVKSISKNPEQDIVYPAGEKNRDYLAMNSVWGKSGNNWANAVDKNGIRYFLFEINRNKFLTDDNPYQVWALPLSLTDKRGLIQVIPTPNITHIPLTGDKPIWKGDTWWNLAGGLPRSGDNTPLLLEDNTLVHMNALGMHSNFFGTITVNNPYNGEVKFLGNYPGLDHISWPHEFRRDIEFALIWSKNVPTVPIVMIDLEHETFWAVAMSNYYDREERAKRAANLRKSGTPTGDSRLQAKTIWSMPNPSPDYTKVGYASSMLTAERPEYEIGDTYIAVVRYPMPPSNLKIVKGKLLWEQPRFHAEIEGYNLYRSNESGKNYKKVNNQIITENNYNLSKKGFYVMTSVEYSGLESRMFSNEVQLGKNNRYRHFYEAETGKIVKPMVPFFEPKEASNSYGVAITDPSLLYKERLSERLLKGSVSLKIQIPYKGATKLMARVRGMSRFECESSTTGWPEKEEIGKGSFTVKVNGKQVGKIDVSEFRWKWVGIDTGNINLAKGEYEVSFETSDSSIALDNIMVTNDLRFTPTSKSNSPSLLNGAPSGLKAVTTLVQGEPLQQGGYRVRPPYVKLVWNEVKVPQGVRYYNVYRSKTPNLKTTSATLVGSTSTQEFLDSVLEAGNTYYYRVVAVDNWDNRSSDSPELTVLIQ